MGKFDMRLIRRTLLTLIRLCFPSKPSRPADIPKKLSPETLDKALQEARMLHARHAIRVSDLTPDEIPGLPRAAKEEPR
jgi:hypothetical protein